MELTDDAAENLGQQAQKKLQPTKKRKNPFFENSKEDREKRRLRRARIIIRNISYKATDVTLREHFAKFGNITELNLLKRPDGKLVGCGFVQYETVNEAAKAILKATNKEFLGRTVYVDWAVGKDEYVKRKASDVKGEVKEEVDVKSEEEDAMEVDLEEEDEDGDASVKEKSDDSEEDSSEEQENDDDEDDSKTEIKTEDSKAKRTTNDVKEGCTVFIKNVPFDATTDDLRKCCRKFGPVYYALINTDPVSGHSRGTGFVKFKSKESADLCLNAGEEFALLGTVMEPHPALSREDVRERNASNESRPSDSRHLYLAKEGLIMAGSKAADGVSASDMSKRHKLEQIKTAILKNLNRFVSRNRLSIHNLPYHYDDEKLRKLIIKFTEFSPHECRVMRENMPSPGHPKGKSKGFGFMSFKTHQAALTALRKLNNNPNVFSSVTRPIVAFSIEDRSVHNIKEKRLKRSLENNPTYKDKLEKQKARKTKKKTEIKDDKSKLQKDGKPQSANKKAEQNNGEKNLDDFVGMPSKPGTFVRMRSNRKIKEQSQEHTKRLSEQKRKDKKRKEMRLHRIEKKQIDRPKMGKQKVEKDNFSLLVNKYKQLLDAKSSSETPAISKKRAKWYVD